MRQREKWFDPPALRCARQKRYIQDQRLLDADLESTNRRLGKQFNGSRSDTMINQCAAPS
jgi:hypothetical protein